MRFVLQPRAGPHAGEAVAADEILIEIETDKVTVEVPSISDGVLTAINAGTAPAEEAA